MADPVSLTDADREALVQGLADAYGVPVEYLTMSDADFHRLLHGPPGPGILDPRDRT